MVLAVAAILVGRLAEGCIQLSEYWVRPLAAHPNSGADSGWEPKYQLPHRAVETPTKELSVVLTRDSESVRVRFINGGSEAKIDASEFGLGAFLQARDRQGAWQPIEYISFNMCGTGRFPIPLPTGHEWTFWRPLATGSLTTSVRLVYSIENVRHYSNEIVTTIAPGRFTQTRAMAKKLEIKIFRGTPLGYSRW